MAFSEYKSTRTVQAEQVEETRSVITPRGPLTAEPGQWEVRHPDGNVQVVDDEQFQESFGSGEDGEGLEKPKEPEPPLEEDEPVTQGAQVPQPSATRHTTTRTGKR